MLHQSRSAKAKTAYYSLNRDNIENVLFSLLILFLPTQLGKHFWPDFSFVNGIRIDYLSPTIFFTDSIILLLFLFSWNRLVFIAKKLVGKHKKIGIIFLIASLLLILNSCLSRAPLLGFYGLLKTVEMAFLGFYVSQVVWTKARMVNSLRCLSVAVSWVSLLAIAQFFHHGSLNGMFYFLGERRFSASTPGIANASIGGYLVLRPYATFPHPNVLGGFLALSLVTLLVWGKLQRDRFLKQKKELVLFVVTCTLGAIGLLLSLSRSAIGFFGLAIVFLLSIGAENRRSVRLFIVVGLLFLLFSSSLLRGRFFDLRGYIEPFLIREDLTNAALHMVAGNLLLGVGAMQFLPTLPHYLKIRDYQLLQPVHNIFLLVVSEYGIILFGVFLFVIIQTYRHLFSFPPLPRWILFGGVTVLLLLGMTDHYFLTLQQGQLMTAIVFGLAWITPPFSFHDTQKKLKKRLN